MLGEDLRCLYSEAAVTSSIDRYCPIYVPNPVRAGAAFDGEYRPADLRRGVSKLPLMIRSPSPHGPVRFEGEGVTPASVPAAARHREWDRSLHERAPRGVLPIPRGGARVAPRPERRGQGCPTHLSTQVRRTVRTASVECRGANSTSRSIPLGSAKLAGRSTPDASSRPRLSGHAKQLKHPFQALNRRES